MTQVSSAAKMVGQLKRWLTGDEASQSTEDIAIRCPTCTCGGVTQYRGRSYSDCCTALGRDATAATDVRERSCSVNSRRTTSSRGLRRLGPSSGGSTWSSARHGDVRQVLDEDAEFHRCPHGRSVEPVCCCERCFVYTDDRAADFFPAPPPYSELILHEHFAADLARKLIDAEPSISAKTADLEKRRTIDGEAADCNIVSGNITPSVATASDDAWNREADKSAQAVGRDSPAAVRCLPASSTDNLPVSVCVSFDGEEGFTQSQQRLRWARRQRLLDDAVATASCPPPNRTICHVVDCW